MSERERWAWRLQSGPQKALVDCSVKEIFFGGMDFRPRDAVSCGRVLAARLPGRRPAGARGAYLMGVAELKITPIDLVMLSPCHSGP
jgi:hypothetical protein